MNKNPHLNNCPLPHLNLLSLHVANGVNVEHRCLRGLNVKMLNISCWKVKYQKIRGVERPKIHEG